MLGLYKKDAFKIGTYVNFPNNVTTLLLDKEDGYYEDVIKNALVGSNDVFKGAIENLSNLTNIKHNYITKKSAIKYYKSIFKEQESEQTNSI